MYRCTDIPGKFVWQPGTLTQAVSKGHWILLEDIDHAPLDVVGICTPESHMELHELHLYSYYCSSGFKTRRYFLACHPMSLYALQISVLLPLMENKQLMIPGREDCIEVAPGFQFFATRR